MLEKKKKKKRDHKYVHVYVCTLTSGSRTTTVPCGQGLGIRGSRTHDLCLNCESGCVHCIPAENLTYQLLDWKGWVPHPSNYSCSTLKASQTFPGTGRACCVLWHIRSFPVHTIENHWWEFAWKGTASTHVNFIAILLVWLVWSLASH